MGRMSQPSTPKKDSNDGRFDWSEYIVPKKRAKHKITNESIVSETVSEHRIIILQALVSVVLSIFVLYEMLTVSIIPNRRVINIAYEAPHTSNPFRK